MGNILEIKKKKENNVVFFHVNTHIDNHEIVYNELINLIHYSGLIDRITKIYVGLVGYDCLKPIPNNSKFKLVYIDSGETNGDYITLHYAHNHAKENDCNILYLHNKWVQYTPYFLIEKYNICLDYLKTKDVVYIGQLSDVSTGFWWASSDYIKTLPDVPSSIESFTINSWISLNNPKIKIFQKRSL